MNLDPVFIFGALVFNAFAVMAGLEKIAHALARDKTVNLHVVIKHEGKEDGPL